MIGRNNIEQIDNDEISLKKLLLLIQKLIYFFIINWKLLVTTTIIGGALGLAYANIKKPQYHASIIFTIEEDRPNISTNSLGSQLLDLGSGSATIFSKNNLLVMLKSESLVKDALLQNVVINKKKTSLINYYIISYFRNKREDTIPYSDKPYSREQIIKIRELSNIILQPIKLVDNINKTSFIQINYNSPDELFANLFLHKLLEVASSKYIKYKTAKTRQTLNILQNQADSLKVEQQKLLEGIALESDNQFNLSPLYNIKRTSSQKKQFNLQSVSASLSQVITNLESSKMSLRKETPLIFIIEDSEFPLKKVEQNKLKFFLLGAFIGLMITTIFRILILNQQFVFLIKNIK